MSYLESNVEFKENWPTPRRSEYKDTGPVGSKSHDHMDGRNYLCAKTKEKGQPTGQLNPVWTSWLMGWPLGFIKNKEGEWEISDWSDIRLLRAMFFIDWSVDPAEIDSDQFWPTPRAGNPGSRPNKKGGKILAEEAKKASIPTPRATDWKDGGWNAKTKDVKETASCPRYAKTFHGRGLVPRVGRNIFQRINRLKCIGNGQVPQCAAFCFDILMRGIDHGKDTTSDSG